MGSTSARLARRAFTLIELLVAIAVIAVLISMLLPALGAARRAARQVVCASNLKQVATAMAAYSLEYKEQIVGSPATSGTEAIRFNRFNGIAIQAYDSHGPLLAFMGIIGPGEGYSLADLTEEVRGKRFDWYRKQGVFQCPSNDILAGPWSGAPSPHFTIGRMTSYNLSTQFTSTERPVIEGGTGDRRISSGIDRRGYQPVMFRVGTMDRKACFWDGARYSSPTEPPDFDHRIHAPYGGSFGGTGPWYDQNREMVRDLAPGESEAGQPNLFDSRRYAFRHGEKVQNIRGTSSKVCLGNMSYFDGHVKLVNDGEATNPDMWFPTGTRINLNNVPLQTWNYTREAWPDKSGSRGEYIVP